MFRFLKRNDSEVITPEVVDMPFVACPPGQLNNPEVTITKKAVDPIVYQPCAYGVLIHSMWGEESEDKVFEEYKRINNLML